MLAGSLPARPARPVADAPLAALTDVDALAKGWLLTLIADSPLAAITGLPAAEMASEAPRLCGALVGALASEAELDRLRGDGDLAPLAARAGALAGAGEPAAAAAAVAALRASLWSAVTDALTRPEPGAGLGALRPAGARLRRRRGRSARGHGRSRRRAARPRGRARARGPAR